MSAGERAEAAVADVQGVEYCAPAGAGAGLRSAKTEDAAVFGASPTAVTVDGPTVTQTYPWGTFVVTYGVAGADLTVTATLRNTSGKGLEGWRANVLQFNDRLVFRPGGDPHGNGIHMQWSHYYELNAGARDGYQHLTQQYPHVYWWVDYAAPFDKQAVKIMVADLTGTWDTGVNRVKAATGDRWPVFVGATSWEMAPPGQVQQATIKVAVRFRDQDAALRPAVDQLYQKAQAAKGPAQAAAWAAFNAAYEQSLPSALEVCADGYEAWGRYNKREASWTDRRPIGAFFACPDSVTSAKNPNGWFKDPAGVDTTTPEGRQAFAKRLLARIDDNIAILKQAGAQGVIWWDLEGMRQPQPLSWIGDPRVLDPKHPHHQAFAPELDTPVEYNGETMPVVDACFRKWKDAGFKTGVTIRPQVLTYARPVPVEGVRARVEAAKAQVAAAIAKLKEAREDPDADPDMNLAAEAAEGAVKKRQAELARAEADLRTAESGSQPNGQSYENGGKETLPKAKYARDRWGCTLFYLDSISGVFGYWAMDEAARALQDCLFLPEWATARSFRCSAQLSITGLTGYRQGVPREIQAAWPDAFCAMFHLDYPGIAAGKNEAARTDLVTAVKRGNLPVFDSFYQNTDALTVIQDVYRRTGVKHAPLAKDQLVPATADQPVSITLTATDEDGDVLTFAILGPPARGTLSAFDAKTGKVTYTPTPGRQGTDSFTFKVVDGTGLNSNRGTVTVAVK